MIYLTYYLYGVIGMAMAESLQRGYEDSDIDLQLVLNAILWPLVILSLFGKLLKLMDTK